MTQDSCHNTNTVRQPMTRSNYLVYRTVRCRIIECQLYIFLLKKDYNFCFVNSTFVLFGKLPLFSSTEPFSTIHNLKTDIKRNTVYNQQIWTVAGTHTNNRIVAIGDWWLLFNGSRQLKMPQFEDGNGKG